MIDSKIIYKEKTKSGRDIIFRYPVIDDAKSLLDYINKISLERTFIRFQGEQLTFEEEEKYLKSLLEKIDKQVNIKLLGFIDGKLVAIAGIDLQDKTRNHLGVFGISVDREFRNEGIGKLLLKNILKESKKLPKLKIITLVVYSPNCFAYRLYKKFGFKDYGLLPGGIKFHNKFVDEILMYKKIK